MVFGGRSGKFLGGFSEIDLGASWGPLGSFLGVSWTPPGSPGVCFWFCEPAQKFEPIHMQSIRIALSPGGKFDLVFSSW